MTFWKLIPVAMAAMLVCDAARAAESCTLTLKPEIRGFFLNPILAKVVVAKATPTVPGQACLLQANDEVLQLNEQVIAGQRANTVMTYWKSLAKDSPRNFKVRRAGAIVALTIK